MIYANKINYSAFRHLVTKNNQQMYQLPAVVENVVPSLSNNDDNNINNNNNNNNNVSVSANGFSGVSVNMMRDEIICCNVCGFTGCDVKLSECGCSFHTVRFLIANIFAHLLKYFHTLHATEVFRINIIQ